MLQLQFSSVAQSCPTLLTTWTVVCRDSLSLINFQSLLKLMSIESVKHPTISSSVVPFFSHLQSFPSSGHFPMSQFFTSGGQIIGVSASASVLPMNIQDWFPLQWTDWISLKSKGLSRIFSSTPHLKSINTLALSFLYSLPLTSRHDYWKNHSFLDLVMLSVQFSPLIWVRFFVTP